MKQLLEQYSAFRKPEWRFEAASVRAAMKSRPNSWGYDKVTRQMVAFLQAKKGFGAGTPGRVAGRHPIPHLAHQIYTHQDDTVKILVEARILAGMTDEEIAESVATYPEVIGYYAKLFYDVRDRLGAKDYIFRQIINSTTAPSKHGLQISELSAKYFAYFGGPILLDFIVNGDAGLDKPRETGELGEYLDKFLTGTIRRRANVAATEISINRYNAVELIGMHYRLLELQAESDTGLPGSSQKWQDNVTRFLSEVPWSFGEEGQRLRADGSVIANIDEAAIELRAEQSIRYQAGEMPAEEIKELASKKLPPPPKKASDSDEQTEPKS